MTTFTRSTSLLLASGLCGVLLVAGAPASLAQAPQRVEFASQSKLWLEGDSTLHRYKSSAKQVLFTIAAATAGADGLRFSTLEVVVPVKGLKSGEGALDDNMYKALLADKHPTIRFTASGGTLQVSKAGAVSGEVKGKLAIAGTERPATVSATGTLVGDMLKLKGSKALSMSEFGVKPPVLFGGMIKTDDAVVVHFDLAGSLKN